VEESYADFDDWWRPFTGGAGPAGAYCTSLAPDAQQALADACRRRLGEPTGPFTVTARAWAVRGRVPGG
jgi:hypothetical protein